MGILLDELESHVWKDGDITDKGKHNDTVMALAHAVDQIKAAQNGGLAVIGVIRRIKVVDCQKI